MRILAIDMGTGTDDNRIGLTRGGHGALEETTTTAAGESEDADTVDLGRRRRRVEHRPSPSVAASARVLEEPLPVAHVLPFGLPGDRPVASREIGGIVGQGHEEVTAGLGLDFRLPRDLVGVVAEIVPQLVAGAAQLLVVGPGQPERLLGGGPLGAEVLLGAGELRSGGAQRGAVLADAVEALIGAVLLDGGTEAAEALIDFLFAEQIAALPDAATLKDPKTRLQEWLQGRGLKLPAYSVESVHGRDHEQTFVVSCEVTEKNAYTTGQGPSRRRAEQEAAAAMLAVPVRCERGLVVRMVPGARLGAMFGLQVLALEAAPRALRSAAALSRSGPDWSCGRRPRWHRAGDGGALHLRAGGDRAPDRPVPARPSNHRTIRPPPNEVLEGVYNSHYCNRVRLRRGHRAGAAAAGRGRGDIARSRGRRLARGRSASRARLRRRARCLAPAESPDSKRRLISGNSTVPAAMPITPTGN